MLLEITLTGNPNQRIPVSSRGANDTDLHCSAIQMTYSSTYPSKCLITSVSANCLVLRQLLSRVRISRLVLSPGESGQCYPVDEIALKNFLSVVRGTYLLLPIKPVAKACSLISQCHQTLTAITSDWLELPGRPHSILASSSWSPLCTSS